MTIYQIFEKKLVFETETKKDAEKELKQLKLQFPENSYSLITRFKKYPKNDSR